MIVRSVVTLIATLTLCLLQSVAHADEFDREVAFDIAPQSLAAAILDFAGQSKIQVVTSGADLEQYHTGGLKGRYSVRVALRTLLSGTGLRFREVGSGTVSIERADSGPASRDRDGLSGANSQPASAAPRAAAEAGPALTEVIVTAQKRDERLQDVPVPVTVVKGDLLADNNQTSLQDYYNTIPGLSISETGSQGYQLLVIRGITTGVGHDPTVGVTIDDVPFGSAQNNGGNQLPDVDPNDLERIEVLRGPQGTLYGANSMGGLIRYVTKDPTAAGFSGNVTAGTSAVRNGAEAGYNFRASANIPLTRDLAVRISGYTRQDPGYIDNPVHHIDGINEEHASGGTLMAKWAPSEAFSLKVRALYQHTNSDGAADVSMGLGDLQQNFPPGIGGLTFTSQLYDAVVNARLGDVNLTSVTGYNSISLDASIDFTPEWGQFAEQHFSVPYAPIFVASSNRVFSQELRFAGSLGAALDWLAGGFYTYQKSTGGSDFAAQSITGAVPGELFVATATDNYREYAGFATLTYYCTDQFDIQFGGRQSHLESHSYGTNSGALVPGTPPALFLPQPPGSSDVFTYAVTPRLKISPDVMVYARVATGYRPGASNGTTPAFISNIPSEYKPDKTQNYELGVKADALEHRLSIDASVYYIDWKDIQVAISNPSGFAYSTNAGGAKSTGVELSITAQPLPGLTIGGWVDYDDAVLTQSAPPYSVYAPTGTRLPFSSRWSGNLSLLQEFPLAVAVTGFVGAQVSLVGDRLGEFPACSSPTALSLCPSAAAPRQDYPNYTQTNLRAGAKYGPWTTHLFINNVTDRRGLIGGGAGAFPPNAVEYIRPRTVGLNVSRSF